MNEQRFIKASIITLINNINGRVAANNRHSTDYESEHISVPQSKIEARCTKNRPSP
jgi:hypothetical protein